MAAIEMARVGLLHFPWRSLRVLQFVIFATSINSTFIVPLSSFYVHEYTGAPLGAVGFLSGSVIGSYFVGRGLTGWIWIAAGRSLGYRPIFTLAIMAETVLTFLLSVSSNVWSCIAIRALSGMFSPLNSLSHLVVRRLATGFGEDVPIVAQTVTFVASVGQAVGFLIGGCFSYPVENSIVDSDSLFSHEPFLLPTIVVGTLQFIALLFFFLDFPDLCEQTENVRQKNKRDIKENSAVGKYAELSESATGNTELQKSEGVVVSENLDQGNPVTERKERSVEENEEDLPAYLQCYELEVVEEYVDSAPAPISQRSAKPGTPLGSTRELPDKKSNTARGHVVSQLISREEPKQSFDETEKGYRQANRSEKTTHISFIEENFQSGSNQRPCQSLEDPFKRKTRVDQQALSLGVVMMVLTNCNASWLEGSMVMWLPAVKDGLSLLLVGVTLAGSVVGVWLLMWMFAQLCRRVPLTRAAVAHSFGLLVLAEVPIILTRVRPTGVFWVLLLIVLQFAIKYLSTFAAAFSELLVSDSVDSSMRQQSLLFVESFAALSKGLAFAGATCVFSYGESSDWAGWGVSFLASGGITFLTLSLLLCSGRHFPRFSIAPYAM